MVHMEGSWQPLEAKFSYVGSLSSIILQTSRDSEGGKSADQIILAHLTLGKCVFF